MTAGSSLLALEAAKAAAEQGPEPFRRYHQRLFSAQFHEARDLGSAGELAVIAEEEGLDPEPISQALIDHRYRPVVLKEYQEAASLGIQAIPTVLFVVPAEEGPARALPVVGAVPTDVYREALALVIGSLAKRRVLAAQVFDRA
jgi:predicted DsbA family dithiol-disulfide isomerase